jgi:hypothetical protein
VKQRKKVRRCEFVRVEKISAAKEKSSIFSIFLLHTWYQRTVTPPMIQHYLILLQAAW